jgi:hypothetical protein
MNQKVVLISCFFITSFFLFVLVRIWQQFNIAECDNEMRGAVFLSLFSWSLTVFYCLTALDDNNN